MQWLSYWCTMCVYACVFPNCTAHLVHPCLVVQHLILHEYAGQLVVGFDHLLGRKCTHQLWEFLEHLVGGRMG